MRQFERNLKKGLFDKLDGRRSYTIRGLNTKCSHWLKQYNLKTVVPGYPLYGVSPLAALLQAMAGVQLQSRTPMAD